MAFNSNEGISGMLASRRVATGTAGDGIDRVVLLTGVDREERDMASFALRELCPDSCAITL